MISTYTYTETRTRTEAVVDQFDMFLQYAGISEPLRQKVLVGVNSRWLDAVGVYLQRAGGRVLEAEVRIDWTAHSDLAVLTPTIRTDLPGWESGASPEIRTVGHRFGTRARELGLSANYWVRFGAFHRQNAAEYRQKCAIVGVDPDSSPPAWVAPFRERSYDLLDLGEMNIALREAP